MADDKDKIVKYDEKTNSYINGRGEALKFTPNSMSMYTNAPDKPHGATHLNIDHEKGTFTLTTHKEGEKAEKQTGQCYLTSACINYYQDCFNDNCYELNVLRWFRDNFVSKEDVEYYYAVAPTIVEKIDGLSEKKNKIYEYIYNSIIKYCIEAINKKDFDKAYQRYKTSVLVLYEELVESDMKKLRK